MKLAELFDMQLLTEMLNEGMVSVRPSQGGHLVIYNYTAKAQYDRVWNEVTRQCRGLIAKNDGTVVSRPWPKFFNYGEHEEGALDLEAAVRAFDKLDGSLGILYPDHQGSYGIATRGSFTSEQALHGTQMLREKIEVGFSPDNSLTYLFEIVYPENRVVVDYGQRRELVLLDVLETETGQQSWGTDWPDAFTWADEIGFDLTLGEALALPPRENSEGLVIRMQGDGLMLKIKQEDYLALHRIVTGLSEKRIWETLCEGTFDELVLGIPDEFAGWANDVAQGLRDDHDEVSREAKDTFNRIIYRLPVAHERKDFALVAKEHPLSGLLFALYDGKSIEDAVWKLVKPVGLGRSFVTTSEDTA